MDFDLFDPMAPVSVTRRALPHWYQTGVTYFVTFRTADSMPAEVIDEWRANRDQWLRAQGLDADDPTWKLRLLHLPRELQSEYSRKFNGEFHRLLDSGHGECLLRHPDVREVVVSALKYFDGQRYHLAAFVVMPNHVHLLLGLIGDNTTTGICYSWKKFTATRINRLLRRTGHFWQGESFDHIVRSPEQFDYLVRYIANNPAKAALKTGEFAHYQSEPST